MKSRNIALCLYLLFSTMDVFGFNLNKINIGKFKINQLDQIQPETSYTIDKNTNFLKISSCFSGFLIPLLQHPQVAEATNMIMTTNGNIGGEWRYFLGIKKYFIMC